MGGGGGGPGNKQFLGYPRTRNKNNQKGSTEQESKREGRERGDKARRERGEKARRERVESAKREIDSEREREKGGCVYRITVSNNQMPLF